MPGIFSWTLPSVYGRTRRLQMPPFLARTDTNVSRAATAMAAGNPGDAVINMDPAADKQDTLFGPNVGIMSSGPRWTESVSEKTPDVDELTPEIVKGWIDKSKEPVQPTTTLQALVNLKRPTLRLTPLHSEAGDAQGADQHALEFAYDSDAPRCAITVTTVHDAGRTVVFEGTFDGGFGRVLSLADGATIDLARFDTTADVTASASATPAQASALPIASTNSHEPATPTQRRFTMPFRRRPRSIAGPAIAVLDAETPAAIPGEAADNKAKEKEEDEGGVRALIRLVALDADGAPVQPANEQTTYLHVVRYGIRASGDEEDTRPWVVKVVKREATIGPHTFHLHEIYGLSSAATTTPAAAPTAPLPSSATYPPTASPTTAAAAAPAHEDEPSSECLLCLSAAREVVLLPCRHLVACKECAINMVEFGAGGQIVHNEEGTNEGETSAAGAGASAETTPDPNAGAETSASASAPAAESPVADAGAAGTSTAGAHAGSPEGTAAGESAQGSPAVAIAPVPTTTQPRRKRRAKGWFCPVCRQPYTSLLRITTVPPASGGKDGKRVSTSTVDHPLSPPAPAVIHNHGRATAQDAARQV